MSDPVSQQERERERQAELMALHADCHRADKVAVFVYELRASVAALEAGLKKLEERTEDRMTVLTEIADMARRGHVQLRRRIDKLEARGAAPSSEEGEREGRAVQGEGRGLSGLMVGPGVRDAHHSSSDEGEAEPLTEDEHADVMRAFMRATRQRPVYEPSDSEGGGEHIHREAPCVVCRAPVCLEDNCFALPWKFPVEGGWACCTDCRDRASAPSGEGQPGHTDLMVSPEGLSEYVDSELGQPEGAEQERHAVETWTDSDLHEAIIAYRDGGGSHEHLVATVRGLRSAQPLPVPTGGEQEAERLVDDYDVGAALYADYPSSMNRESRDAARAALLKALRSGPVPTGEQREAEGLARHVSDVADEMEERGGWAEAAVEVIRDAARSLAALRAQPSGAAPSVEEEPVATVDSVMSELEARYGKCCQGAAPHCAVHCAFQEAIRRDVRRPATETSDNQQTGGGR